MKRIYLDHAATTPLDKRVAKVMRDFELEFFGNPNSTHREGQQARGLIDFARAQIAKFLNAKPQEIIFTSGATEANNLAVQGVITNHLANNKTKPHVVTTKLEHQSVYNIVKEFEKRGVIEATFVGPDKNGIISAESVLAAVKPNTILVSVIFVSNEIGTVLSVREIGKALPTNVVFHTDAVQAAKFYNLNVEKLGCDLLTISSHKLYGPKGIGALFVKTGLKMANLSFGGSQEYGLRPGTQNTAGIIGFAKALELFGTLEDRQALGEKISKLRDLLIDELKNISESNLNGPAGETRTPDNVNMTFYGVDQDALMTALDLAGISASTGSACVSGSSEPSHVIQSLLREVDGPAAVLRLTLGKTTTAAEVKTTSKVIKNIINQLRS